MDEYCQENNYIKWFETSAKEGFGIDEAAQCLVSKILEIENANARERDAPYGWLIFCLPFLSKERRKSNYFTKHFTFDSIAS